MLKLAIMNHRLNMLDDEVPARQRQRAERFWVCPWLSADRLLQFGHYDQLKKELRMEDSSSFFNRMRIETHILAEIPTELVVKSIRVTPTSGVHLNQA